MEEEEADEEDGGSTMFGFIRAHRSNDPTAITIRSELISSVFEMLKLGT